MDCGARSQIFVLSPVHTGDYSRQNRRLSKFGDYSRQCGQGFSHAYVALYPTIGQWGIISMT